MAAEQSRQPRDEELPARRPFTANDGLRIAQLVVLVQAALALVTGFNLVQGGMSLARLGSGVNLPASTSLASNYGIGIVIIGLLFIAGAVLITIPSQIIRTLLALLEIVALGLTLTAHFGGGSVLGLATVLGVGSSGSALVPFGAVVGLQSAAIYLLAMHPATYRAFDR